MNWKSFVSAKSLVNAVAAFFMCYGVATLAHLPNAWLLGVVAVVANQIGLHQNAPVQS